MTSDSSGLSSRRISNISVRPRVLVDEGRDAVALGVGLVKNLLHAGSRSDEVAVRLERLPVQLGGATSDGLLAGAVAAQLALVLHPPRDGGEARGVPVGDGSAHVQLLAQAVNLHLQVVGTPVAGHGGDLKEVQRILARAAWLHDNVARYARACSAIERRGGKSATVASGWPAALSM